MKPKTGDADTHSQKSTLNWLMDGVKNELSIDAIFVQLCSRLSSSGINLARASLHFRTYHPQWLGSRAIWWNGVTEAETAKVGYEIERTAEFLGSPFSAIFSGSNEVRVRLDGDKPLLFPLYEELRGKGITDYVAWPIDHTQGRRHLVTFATDDPNGFSENALESLAEVLPALALVSEVRLKNQLARTLLETYVGPHASDKILEGATTRGSGVTVKAAVLICDLRGFTKLSDSRPRDEVISILNRYFDAIVVASHLGRCKYGQIQLLPKRDASTTGFSLSPRGHYHPPTGAHQTVKA